MSFSGRSVNMDSRLLQVKDIKKYFPLQKTWLSKSNEYLKAVDGVTFSVMRKETFALVGESGSGKTTTGLMTVKLLASTSGSIIFDQKNITTMSEREVRSLRRDFQIIFQNPLSALDPRMTIRSLIREPIRTLLPDNMDERGIIREIMSNVSLDESLLDKHPFQLSGGQNQRVSIARALVTKPKFLVLDEPTSALDVSIQAQIINLLKKLQREFGLTYLFITHDLGIVNYMAERVAVMYLGKIIEIGNADEIFNQPLHPYTQALVSSVPIPAIGSKKRESVILEGEMPSPRNIPTGCRFRSRCKFAMKICEDKEPELEIVNNNRSVACYLVTPD